MTDKAPLFGGFFHGREVLAATGLTDADWNRTINSLLDRDDAVRTG